MAEALFIPEIVEQHSENAASLWVTRDIAVGPSSYRLLDLIRLDGRIEANIDGLRVAATSGWSPSIDELKRGGAGDYFVAGVLALESNDSGRFDQITEQAYAAAAVAAGEPYHPAYDTWRGLISALAWVNRSHASGIIGQLLDTPRPRTRWLGVAASGARRAVRQSGLEAALADREPLVRARAARTVGELGRADLRASLNALLTDADEDCRFWAAWSSTRLGTTDGLRSLAEFARTPGQRRAPALDLLLRCLSIERAHAFVSSLAPHTASRRLTIRACGVIGDGRYLPWLAAQASEPKLARVAAEAFVTITGADIGDLDRAPPPGLQSGPNDDPADEHVMLYEDSGLAWPDPAKLGRWWEGNKTRFSAGTAYFLGTAKPAVNWIDALSAATQRQRQAAALELGLRHPQQAMFEVRARGTLQRRLLLRAEDDAQQSN
jgi:uncharacterized protein (TIGR02270 family)